MLALLVLVWAVFAGTAAACWWLYRNGPPPGLSRVYPTRRGWVRG